MLRTIRARERHLNSVTEFACGSDTSVYLVWEESCFDASDHGNRNVFPEQSIAGSSLNSRPTPSLARNISRWNRGGLAWLTVINFRNGSICSLPIRNAPERGREDSFLPPRQILSQFERFGLTLRGPPRLGQFDPLSLDLRVKPFAAGAPAAQQELLMALLRVHAA